MIYLGADKHGFKTLEAVFDYLKSHNLNYENLGIETNSEDIELEVLIPRVVKEVLKNTENRGILTCGTGVGVEVGANKFSGIRACLAVNEKVAGWSREFDDCNILCLPGWDMNKERISKILDAWFKTKYDGNPDRLKMFRVFNSWH